MRHLSIDIETFSDVDIKKSGLYKYVQSAQFQILLFAYSFDNEPVKIIDLASGEKLTDELLLALNDKSIIKHAFNASFEIQCLSKFYETTVEQWQCTMVHSLYCGLPGSLASVAVALGLPEEKRKLNIGSALIRTFCVPQNPTNSNGFRTRVLPHQELEKWNLFKEYCIKDVEVEMEIEKRLKVFPMTAFENRLWELDQVINSKGVKVDRKLVEGAIYCDTEIKNKLTDEAIKLSNLENPKSVKQLSEWLQKEIDVEIVDLKKENVKNLIKTIDNDKAKRMLELRAELSKASVKKYAAMYEAVCDDERIRGLLQFYGANRTGRWAGRSVQIHNLPRNYIATLSLARDLVIDKRLADLKMLYGNVSDVLSQLIRTAFITTDENHILVIADFSAIEARIIAWLADEKWRLDVFSSHGKIYEASASQMFGVPIEKITKGNAEYELRQKGKIAELALGYQGSKPALVTMGALNMGIDEADLMDIVNRWRNSNKRIVDLWYSVENAALNAVKTGSPVAIKNLIFAREVEGSLDSLTVTLPSGRRLFYNNPVIKPNAWGNESICYMGVNQTSKKWEEIPTYGGKLVENIVQAISRDCLAVSMVRLNNFGYDVVMHIHDEVVVDAKKDYADLEKICKIMGQPIPWAKDLILKAEGFTTEYYKKD